LITELEREFDVAGHLRAHSDLDLSVRDDLGDALRSLMIDLNQKLEELGVKGVIELDEIEESEVLNLRAERI
jgi:hypothetical protein